MNEISEKRLNPLLTFLGYFWGPIAWMVEIAAALSAIVRHWTDLIIIMILLVFNGVIGFWEEYQAGNAIEQLRKNLALTARVLRDGKWQEIEARRLFTDTPVALSHSHFAPIRPQLSRIRVIALEELDVGGLRSPVREWPVRPRGSRIDGRFVDISTAGSCVMFRRTKAGIFLGLRGAQ